MSTQKIASVTFSTMKNSTRCYVNLGSLYIIENIDSLSIGGSPVFFVVQSPTKITKLIAVNFRK